MVHAIQAVQIAITRGAVGGDKPLSDAYDKSDLHSSLDGTQLGDYIKSHTFGS